MPKIKIAEGIPSVAEEFAAADLGNISRTLRLCWLADVMSVAPEKSFPDIVDDDSDLEAIYRQYFHEHPQEGERHAA